MKRNNVIVEKQLNLAYSSKKEQRCGWCNEIIRFIGSRKRLICSKCRRALSSRDLKLLKERMKNQES